MSALGQKQTHAVQKLMSHYPRKRTCAGATCDVRLGPIADISLFLFFNGLISGKRIRPKQGNPDT